MTDPDRRAPTADIHLPQWFWPERELLWPLSASAHYAACSPIPQVQKPGESHLRHVSWHVTRRFTGTPPQQSVRSAASTCYMHDTAPCDQRVDAYFHRRATDLNIQRELRCQCRCWSISGFTAPSCPSMSAPHLQLADRQAPWHSAEGSRKQDATTPRPAGHIQDTRHEHPHPDTVSCPYCKVLIT